MPPLISRGFRGRRGDAPAGRVPPGQYVTRRLPGALRRADAAHAARASGTSRSAARSTSRARWTWEEFRALPSETITVDIHCVTKWSKLDTVWAGRLGRHAARRRRARRPRTCVAFCDGGYTTNLPLEDVTGGKAWVAYAYDGEPLAPEHGGPARLLVPHLYFWKSAKWVRGLRAARRRRARLLGDATATTTTATHGRNSATGATDLAARRASSSVVAETPRVKTHRPRRRPAGRATAPASTSTCG